MRDLAQPRLRRHQQKTWWRFASSSNPNLSTSRTFCAAVGDALNVNTNVNKTKDGGELLQHLWHDNPRFTVGDCWVQIPIYHLQQKNEVLLHCQEVLEEVPPKVLPPQKTVSKNIFLILYIHSKCLSFLHKPLVSLHDPKGQIPPAHHREGFVLKFLLLTWKGDLAGLDTNSF